MLELGPAMAAGGPLNAVSVSGGNLTWVVIVAVIALAALAVAGVLVREVLARQEVEKLAAQIDWKRAGKALRPPQEWFDDTDNPFEPEKGPTP